MGHTVFDRFLSSLGIDYYRYCIFSKDAHGPDMPSTEEKRETPLDILKRDMQRARLTRRSLIKEKGLEE